KFDEALQLLDANSAPTAALAFERAYCFYRAKRIDDALNIVRSYKEPRPARFLELEAQIVSYLVILLSNHAFSITARKNMTSASSYTRFCRTNTRSRLLFCLLR